MYKDCVRNTGYLGAVRFFKLTKMDTSKKTKGEWKYKDNTVYAFSPKEPIAEVRNYSNSEECVANAAFICKAVNGYEDLLNALKVCQFQLQTWAENDAWSVADESAYELAAEAIKKSGL